jgi:putative MATE family efflux protein
MMTMSPRFVTGPVLGHVVVMAGTGAIGLIAVFGVDLLNLFYISLLGQQPIAAAVGFSGTVGFLQTSIAIGMTIGVGAVVSRRIGAEDMDQARALATSSLLLMTFLTLAVGLASVALRYPLLDALGASGETRQMAAAYLAITSLSLPLLSAGMCCAALLRSVGDARRAMGVTLVGALSTAVLDPILIFALHLDLEGAAFSTVLSRLVLASLGWHYVTHVHGLLARPEPSRFASDASLVMSVAGPAILTNLATPIGNAYVTYMMARFGSGAVAGEAMIDRVSPVAFGLIYALTGAVGPIIAQNLGALRFDRVRETLRDSLLVVVITVCLAWAVLALCAPLVLLAFSATGDAATMVRLFCHWLAGAFLFTGALFVANAAFNNLGHPLLSTLFNWGRATLGTIPFVTLGARHGPPGILLGQAAGSFIFGVLAVIVAFRVTYRLGTTGRRFGGPALSMSGTSGKASLAAMLSLPERH